MEFQFCLYIQTISICTKLIFQYSFELWCHEYMFLHFSLSSMDYKCIQNFRGKYMFNCLYYFGQLLLVYGSKYIWIMSQIYWLTEIKLTRSLNFLSAVLFVFCFSCLFVLYLSIIDLYPTTVLVLFQTFMILMSMQN